MYNNTFEYDNIFTHIILLNIRLYSKLDNYIGICFAIFEYHYAIHHDTPCIFTC